MEPSMKVLMFPWLAHGHIFPYLELAKRLLKIKKFSIYLCSTSINFSSITNFLIANSLQNEIELIELHLQPNPNLPRHYHTTKNLPSHLNTTLLKAFQTSKASFSHILHDLSPDLLIYDFFQPWAPKLSLSLGIPAVHFAPFGAATTAYVRQRYSNIISTPGCSCTFPELALGEKERETLDSLMEFLSAHVFDHHKDPTFINHAMSTEVVLLKTCRGLESKYLDYVSSVSQKRILAVGPLAASADDDDDDRSEILDWLSQKPSNSTVYISFGSECFLSVGEREEIEKGLELCGVSYIWVIRSPATAISAINAEEGEKEEEELLVQRGRGMVVKGWAPQAKILGHPSIGAFVSHCGWSSLCESIYYGVAVIAMPMKLNMMVDAKMLVDVGAGVEIRRGEDGVYRGEEIGRTIGEVIGGGRGMRLRERARELSEKMRMEEGEAIDEAAQILWQLCGKKKGGNVD